MITCTHALFESCVGWLPFLPFPILCQNVCRGFIERSSGGVPATFFWKRSRLRRRCVLKHIRVQKMYLELLMPTIAITPLMQASIRKLLSHTRLASCTCHASAFMWECQGNVDVTFFTSLSPLSVLNNHFRWY